jgi:hypothetical protein
MDRPNATLDAELVQGAVLTILLQIGLPPLPAPLLAAIGEIEGRGREAVAKIEGYYEVVVPRYTEDLFRMHFR